jgi:type IV pilus assembly protein PilW
MKLFRPNMTKIRGFSLVELMVAITIGLIILAAVSAVFVSSKRSYSTQDRLARLQENARFAMQFMTRDIRMAGYSGCVKDLPNINNVSGLGSMNIALEGIDNAESTSTWLPSAATRPADIKDDTDALAIRAGDPSQITSLTSAMESESDPLPVTSTDGLNDNNIILVADCSNADVLQITTVNSPLLEHTANLGKLYDTSAQVMKFYTRIYYVKNRADGTPALFLDENGSEQELVEGVEDLQILYGVDTDADNAPNVYLNATDVAAAWANVKSVRIGMLVRTPNDRDLDTDVRSTYDVNGNTFTVPTDADGNRDRHQRRVFQTTIQVRNL